MPKKQTSSTSTSQNAAGAVPARAVKTATPRGRNAKHSKAAVEPIAAPVAEIALPIADEFIVDEMVVEEISIAAPGASTENAHDAIAKTAYSYWEARGYQGGNPLEDWVRAEEEHRRRGR